MRALIAMIVVGLLAGCSSSVVQYQLARAEDRDCFWLRAITDEPVCKPYRPPAPAAPAEPVNCRPTLGEATCYVGTPPGG